MGSVELQHTARLEVVDERDALTSAKAIATLERLQQQQAERTAGKERRQREREDAEDPNESIARFLEGFSASRGEIEASIRNLQAEEQLSGAAAARARDALYQLSLAISGLEEQAAQAAYFLPPYEQRSCAASIQSLRKALEDCKSKVLPAKKFAFRGNVTRVPASALASEPGPAPARPTLPAPTIAWRGEEIGGRRGERIVRGGEELRGMDVNVVDLEDCTVVLTGQLRALRLRNLRRCRVLAAAVVGSVFVDSLEDCQAFLAANQIRIHSSSSVDFYLRVNSKPIIEHTSAVRFAPLPPPDASLQALLDDAGLGQENDRWRAVEDFGWIKAAQSPHWSVLPDDERRGDLSSLGLA